jgi:SAM-dependent methyltransferase
MRRACLPSAGIVVPRAGNPRRASVAQRASPKLIEFAASIRAAESGGPSTLLRINKPPHSQRNAMSNRSEDAYAISARYYDAAYAAIELVDQPFYLDLARQVGGPVLEIACGTGRVLLPIARTGIAIDGLDASPAMLDVLKSKLEGEPEEVRQRVTLHAGDMRDARLNRKFRLVIIPFRPLQHMLTLEDQLATLRTAAAHLSDEGKLAFDVFYPRFDSLLSGIGEERLEMEWAPPAEPSTVIRRFYRKDSVDKINQKFSGVFIYRFFENDRMVREERAPLYLTWYTYPQVRALLLIAGLEAREEYGSFAKAPLDNSSTEMIFICTKSGVNANPYEGTQSRKVR